MKKVFRATIIMVLLACFATNANAQSFLKKAAAAVTSAAVTETLLKINYEAVPKYTIKVVKDGTKNEDGTEKLAYYLVDQNGNIRTAEAVKKQHGELNKAVAAIIAKVGAGAAVGAIASGGGKDAAKGALIGGAVGAVSSIGDINQARELKKSLSEQKKLIASYEKNFTKEGVPVSAKVDVSKIEGIDSEPLTLDGDKLKELLAQADNSSTDDFLSE